MRMSDLGHEYIRFGTRQDDKATVEGLDAENGAVSLVLAGEEVRKSLLMAKAWPAMGHPATHGIC